MCGIVGYAGASEAYPLLVEGIRLLSYRGYDSAGVAVQQNGSLSVLKDAGRIGDLAPAWGKDAPRGVTGIGHTRWATHGRPNRKNAHPQTDATGEVAVIHNGIIENDLALREELEAQGVTFASDTDTEVFAHLFARHRGAGPLAAARVLLERCRGAYALAILDSRLPGTVVALRRRSPLLVGYGVGENLVASDLRALLGRADRFLALEDDEVALVTRDRIEVFDRRGRPVVRAPRPVDARQAEAGKDGYAHFMLKEIHEQPDRLYELLGARVDAAHRRVRLDEVPLTDADWRALERVDLVACGTAHYASQYGALALEALAGIPARAIPASEYDARDPALGPRVLVVAVTQSGETTDTAGAVEVARSRGARTIGVLNVRESLIGRLVEGIVDIHAGPEIGVASTKAYTAMLASLFLLSLRAASARGRADRLWQEAAPDLQRLPDLVRATVGDDASPRRLAHSLHAAPDMLYLGRGPDAATALEGALKMKEISYVHAEGYPAGEMKHGPIALVSEGMPVVAVATPGPWRERMLGNIQEVRARDGRVIAVAAADDAEVARVASEVMAVPRVHPWLAPIVNVLPLQLLAYETAKRRGCDIDQPRNLAKTVTVP